MDIKNRNAVSNDTKRLLSIVPTCILVKELKIREAVEHEAIYFRTPQNVVFDKKAFAKLLLTAKGDRSLNQFALSCGISSAHLSRLTRELLDTPPGPETIKKIADRADGGITYLDLMKAAGYL